ncbi:alpha-amylase [Synechococcales cyanobacterium C]|uniref:Alpha-amylase n=1 Tax=Petrachloros mirabilis ULC683 TaxID=2781853 RepID=A0A8K2A2M5_9CYAN|nr:glycoside hydrolase family 13 protein [Petrachloros mirabilis]NCJ08452.1 alpha-amylase [Petrachloros mirabilis ULC683]
MSVVTPDWVKHAVFYEIFPDRFGRSGHQRQGSVQCPIWEDWQSQPTLQGYKGGDLWGVLERLDYLQDLGVTALYFTPIFQSACNHRYHTHDYFQVDPLLGGNSALEALLKAAHARQIKIVLDGVFNHASRGFFFFNDILENGAYSPWLDWFKIEGWPLAPYRGDLPANYVSWDNYRALPQFNHDNPEVQAYLFEVAEFWIRFGIDGWRLDVPYEVKTPGFWQAFRQRVKALNPQAYIVGEVWGDAQPWLGGSQFDGVMNYQFTGPTLAFVAGDRVLPELVEATAYEAFPAIDASIYGAKMQTLLQRHPWDIQLTQFNLLASHDTARLLSIAQGDRSSVELATLLLFTFPGAPCIYYGDEVGLPGGLDPDNRRVFPELSQWDAEILAVHRRLIELRHQHIALRLGRYEVLVASGGHYIFIRRHPDEVLMVAVNVETEVGQIRFSQSQAGISVTDSVVLYGNPRCESFADKDGVVELAGRSGCILGCQGS